MLHRIYDEQEPYCMSPSEERILEARDEGFEKGYNQAIQEFEHKQEELMEKQIKNIYQRINEVMAEVEAVQKENKKVNGQYTFVSHDAVSKALHNPMVKAGIVMIPTIKELKQDGNRTEVTMEISFVNMDNPQEKVTVQYNGYGIDAQDKGIGKAISYAVKYALLKVFCLETGDDVEKDSIEYRPELINNEQVELINQLGAQNPKQMEKILKALKNDGIYAIEQVPVSIYERIVKALQKPVPVAA